MTTSDVPPGWWPERPCRWALTTGRATPAAPALRIVHPVRDAGEVARWRVEQWGARPWARPSNRPYRVSTDE